MTTTLQSIQDGAVSSSIANGLASLVADRAEIIRRIAAHERQLFDIANKVNRAFFARITTLTSNAAAGGRIFTLAFPASVEPVARILKIVLQDGRELNQVDVMATDTELSPRYYVVGKACYEVGSDWGAGAGAITALLTYVYGPKPLDVAGDLTQTTTLPDEFADLLEFMLAMYLVTKDVGRAEELPPLEAILKARLDDFTTHITQFSGAEARTFAFPQRGDKQ